MGCKGRLQPPKCIFGTERGTCLVKCCSGLQACVFEAAWMHAYVMLWVVDVLLQFGSACRHGSEFRCGAEGVETPVVCQSCR